MSDKKYYYIQGILTCITLLASISCLFFTFVALSQNNITFDFDFLKNHFHKIARLWAALLIATPFLGFIMWFIKKKIQIYKSVARMQKER